MPLMPLSAETVRALSSTPSLTRLEYRKSNSVRERCRVLLAAMLIEAFMPRLKMLKLPSTVFVNTSPNVPYLFFRLFR